LRRGGGTGGKLKVGCEEEEGGATGRAGGGIGRGMYGGGGGFALILE